MYGKKGNRLFIKNVENVLKLLSLWVSLGNDSLLKTNDSQRKLQYTNCLLNEHIVFLRVFFSIDKIYVV